MGRKKTGLPPGRTPDFTGEKQEWLDTFRADFLDPEKEQGSLYTDATNRFIQRYGYDLPIDENVVGRPEDLPPPDASTGEGEEKTRRAAIRKTLRGVRTCLYHTEYRADVPKRNWEIIFVTGSAARRSMRGPSRIF